MTLRPHPTLLDSRYELLEPLGSGGMAQVIRGWDRRLRRDVAIKFLAPHISQDSGLGERFRQEITALAQLDHPNIVTIFDTGEGVDGRLYLVMERLLGETLEQTLNSLRERNEALAWSRLAMIGRQLCAALQTAHGRNIVHRDIKPSNIFRLSVDGNRDFIKLVDFGIAKVVTENRLQGEREASLTDSGTFVGTPHYAAPEMIAPERYGKPDARADIYSLGVVLYECAAGLLPHEGLPRMAVLARTALEKLPPPRERAPEREIPRALETLIIRATALSPQDRFASARELGAALAMFEATLAPVSTSVNVGAPSATTRRTPRAHQTPPLRLQEGVEARQGRGTRMLGSRDVEERAEPTMNLEPEDLELIHEAIAATQLPPPDELPPEPADKESSEQTSCAPRPPTCVDENPSTAGRTPLVIDDAVSTSPDPVVSGDDRGAINRLPLILAAALAAIVIAAWAWMPEAVEDSRTTKTVIDSDVEGSARPVEENSQELGTQRPVDSPQPVRAPERPTRTGPSTAPDTAVQRPKAPPRSRPIKPDPAPEAPVDPKTREACEHELEGLFDARREQMMVCLSKSGVSLLTIPDLRIRLRSTERRAPSVEVVRPSAPLKPAVKCIEGLYKDSTAECKTRGIEVVRTL